MTRTVPFAAALAMAVGLLAGGATAQQQGSAAPAQQQAQARMSIAEIATMLEGQGYNIREIELERGRYDVEMIDDKGMRVEAYLDPVSGEVLPCLDDRDRYDGNDDARYDD